MLQVREGNFGHIIPAVNREDELGILMNCFNDMSLRIHRLIHESYEQRLAQQENELRILNLHFNPHFIYNTLSVIYIDLEKKRDHETSALVLALIDMLRSSSRTKREFWPLRSELRWLDSYLLIMQKRQSTKFLLEYHIPEELMRIPVLKHLFQPFVENAILHGFLDREAPGYIHLFATRADKRLTIRIYDNGCGFDADKVLSEPGGVNMVSRSNRRIQLAYGEECGVQVFSTPGNGTEVVILLRIEEEGDAPAKTTAQE
jgi:two-component system sensor histidine kinase YesM